MNDVTNYLFMDFIRDRYILNTIYYFIIAKIGLLHVFINLKY